MTETITMATRTDWNEIGREHNGTKEGRAKIRAAVTAIEWQEIPKGGTLDVAMMPGMGIEEAVKQYNIPKVSHIAISSALAPFGLYGIRGHYKNVDVDVFVIDEGHQLMAICQDVTERKMVTA